MGKLRIYELLLLWTLAWAFIRDHHQTFFRGALATHGCPLGGFRVASEDLTIGRSAIQQAVIPDVVIKQRDGNLLPVLHNREALLCTIDHSIQLEHLRAADYHLVLNPPSKRKSIGSRMTKRHMYVFQYDMNR